MGKVFAIVLNRVALTVMFGLISVCAWSQEQWERDGEIEDVEIEIVRERQITLPRANRNFEKVAPRPSEPIEPAITYEFRNLSFKTPDYNPTVRPLRLKQEDISKLYGNYVSAGYGNYASPYLSAWFTTKRDKQRFMGANVYHRSFGNGPVDDKNSASASTEVKLFGKVFGPAATAGGYVGYENTGGYFYGYTPGLETSRDSIKQSYNWFSLGGELTNTKPADFNYKLSGSFGYLTDYYEAAESDLGISFDSDYKVGDSNFIRVESSYSLIARKDSLVDANPRHLLKAKPSFQFQPVEGLKIEIGANVVLENDSIRNKSLHVYPAASADFSLSKSVSLYGSLGGDIEKVNLRSLSSENLWVNSNIDIFHTNKTLELTAGLKGKVGNRAAFDIGFAAANLKDLYFYRNAAADLAKFDVVYDRGNVQRINLYGQFGFNRNEVMRFNLRGDYYGYSTDQQQEAWHRPTYRVSASTGFNVYQKLLIDVMLLGQGGMKAFDDNTGTVVTLDPALDLNVKASYLLSKQASVFLRFDNVLATDYPIFLNYPVRGFQVMAGIGWSF